MNGEIPPCVLAHERARGPGPATPTRHEVPYSMTRSRSTVLARLAVMVVAVGLATSVLPATSASAATARVPAGFFGMTDHDPTSWPAQPVGAVRLWDTGVTWRDIERSNGVFDFTRLDAQVASARSHNARV